MWSKVVRTRHFVSIFRFFKRKSKISIKQVNMISLCFWLLSNYKNVDPPIHFRSGSALIIPLLQACIAPFHIQAVVVEAKSRLAKQTKKAMEKLVTGNFPHICEKILGPLQPEDFLKCLCVSKSWKAWIEGNLKIWQIIGCKVIHKYEILDDGQPEDYSSGDEIMEEEYEDQHKNTGRPSKQFCCIIQIPKSCQKWPKFLFGLMR